MCKVPVLIFKCNFNGNVLQLAYSNNMGHRIT